MSTHRIKRAEAKLEGKLSSALHALKHRNFKLFLSGQLVSLIGNYIQTVAQAWLVYRLTGSAALLGLVAFAGQISIFVLAPISGVVADSKSRKHLQENVCAADIALTAEDLAEIDRVVPPGAVSGTRYPVGQMHRLNV